MHWLKRVMERWYWLLYKFLHRIYLFILFFYFRCHYGELCSKPDHILVDADLEALKIQRRQPMSHPMRLFLTAYHWLSPKWFAVLFLFAKQPEFHLCATTNIVAISAPLLSVTFQSQLVPPFYPSSLTSSSHEFKEKKSKSLSIPPLKNTQVD